MFLIFPVRGILGMPHKKTKLLQNFTKLLAGKTIMGHNSPNEHTDTTWQTSLEPVFWQQLELEERSYVSARRLSNRPRTYLKGNDRKHTIETGWVAGVQTVFRTVRTCPGYTVLSSYLTNKENSRRVVQISLYKTR